MEGIGATGESVCVCGGGGGDFFFEDTKLELQ